MSPIGSNGLKQKQYALHNIIIIIISNIIIYIDIILNDINVNHEAPLAHCLACEAQLTQFLSSCLQMVAQLLCNKA